MPVFGDLSGNRSRYGRGARRDWAFEPYTPPPIPAGSYDPLLDSQLAAAQRGYGDTEADIGTAATRATVDYGLNTDDINRSWGRTQQDYDRSVQMLTRKYTNLGTVQAQQQAGAGVLGGGAILQANAKRAANQALEKTDLDTALGRAREDRDIGLGRAALGYGRTTTDLGNQLTRAGRELGAFGLDTASAKAFQAAQSGWQPPTKPANEFTSPGGTTYRVLKGKGGPIYVDRLGRRLKGRPA